MIEAHVYIVKYEFDDEVRIQVKGDRDAIVAMIASAIVTNDIMIGNMNI